MGSIFDNSYRRNFIKNADCKALNEYLKNMEKLSKRGNKYLAIYNDDMDYILNSLSNSQAGGDFFGLLFGDKNKAIMTEQPVCDTEGYINRINNLTKNSYCSIITQKTNQCDNTCESRLMEMDLVKQILTNEAECIHVGKDWEKAIVKFIDMVICCGNIVTQKEYEDFRKNYFVCILKIITRNNKFLKYAYTYLNTILRNEEKKISPTFIKAISDLRKKKGNINYATEKKKLIENSINNREIGFTKTYISKMVEKIYNAYTKMAK
jgi:hypothetical protein